MCGRDLEHRQRGWPDFLVKLSRWRIGAKSELGALRGVWVRITASPVVTTFSATDCSICVVRASTAALQHGAVLGLGPRLSDRLPATLRFRTGSRRREQSAEQTRQATSQRHVSSSAPRDAQICCTRSLLPASRHAVAAPWCGDIPNGHTA